MTDGIQMEECPKSTMIVDGNAEVMVPTSTSDLGSVEDFLSSKDPVVGAFGRNDNGTVNSCNKNDTNNKIDPVSSSSMSSDPSLDNDIVTHLPQPQLPDNNLTIGPDTQLPAGVEFKKLENIISQTNKAGLKSTQKLSEALNIRIHEGIEDEEELREDKTNLSGDNVCDGQDVSEVTPLQSSIPDTNELLNSSLTEKANSNEGKNELSSSETSLAKGASNIIQSVPPAKNNDENSPGLHSGTTVESKSHLKSKSKSDVHIEEDNKTDDTDELANILICREWEIYWDEIGDEGQIIRDWYEATVLNYTARLKTFQVFFAGDEAKTAYEMKLSKDIVRPSVVAWKRRSRCAIKHFRFCENLDSYRMADFEHSTAFSPERYLMKPPQTGSSRALKDYYNSIDDRVPADIHSLFQITFQNLSLVVASTSNSAIGPQNESAFKAILSLKKCDYDDDVWLLSRLVFMAQEQLALMKELAMDRSERRATKVNVDQDELSMDSDPLRSIKEYEKDLKSILHISSVLINSAEQLKSFSQGNKSSSRCGHESSSNIFDTLEREYKQANVGNKSEFSSYPIPSLEHGTMPQRRMNIGLVWRLRDALRSITSNMILYYESEPKNVQALKLLLKDLELSTALRNFYPSQRISKIKKEMESTLVEEEENLSKNSKKSPPPKVEPKSLTSVPIPSEEKVDKKKEPTKYKALLPKTKFSSSAAIEVNALSKKQKVSQSSTKSSTPATNDGNAVSQKRKLDNSFDDPQTYLDQTPLLLDSLLSIRSGTKESFLDPLSISEASGNEHLRNKNRLILRGSFLKGMQMLDISLKNHESKKLCEIMAWKLEGSLMTAYPPESRSEKLSSQYKKKMRSLKFNLEDYNNPKLCARVLLGKISCEKVVKMSAEQLSSDRAKEIRKRASAEAMKGKVMDKANRPKALPQLNAPVIPATETPQVPIQLSFTPALALDAKKPFSMSKHLLKSTGSSPSTFDEKMPIGSSKQTRKPSPSSSPSDSKKPASSSTSIPGSTLAMGASTSLRKHHNDIGKTTLTSTTGQNKRMKSETMPSINIQKSGRDWSSIPESKFSTNNEAYDPDLLLGSPQFSDNASDDNDGEDAMSVDKHPLKRQDSNGVGLPVISKGNRSTYTIIGSGSNPPIFKCSLVYDEAFANENFAFKFLSEKIEINQRIRFPEFDTFVCQKMDSSDWHVVPLRMSFTGVSTLADNSNYKRFYKEYEFRKRVACSKLKDDYKTSIYFVTPMYVAKANCLSLASNQGSTYVVLVTKAPLQQRT